MARGKEDSVEGFKVTGFNVSKFQGFKVSKQPEMLRVRNRETLSLNRSKASNLETLKL